MIKFETIGMIDRGVNNPVLVSENDVTNNDIITIDDTTYLISNVLSGDDYQQQDKVIKAGDFLNGWDLKSLEGQNLIIDMKHITDKTVAKDAVLVPDSTTGKLKVGTGAGINLVVVDNNVRLTEKAVVAKITIAEATETAKDNG